MRHLNACGNHLTAVHNRAAAQGDNSFGVGLKGLQATGFDDGNGRLGIDVIEHRITDLRSFQRR